MSSVVLKWVANGLIAVVLACTLWMAQAIQPERAGSSQMLAQATAAAAAASTPGTPLR
ncbi:MAG: hypothetical protein GXC94_08980 [Comamonadaceae bacterium]|jgi:hypothetical protein|nr:hypothetical protein [Comamonadaceae bacterium]